MSCGKSFIVFVIMFNVYTYINQKQKEVENLLKKGERLNRKLFKKTISSLEMTG